MTNTTHNSEVRIHAVDTSVNGPVFAEAVDGGLEDAWLELGENGAIYVYHYHKGPGVPEENYFNWTPRWSISPQLDAEQCNKLMTDCKPLLERVYEGHVIEWDGRNRVGRFNDDAAEASEEIQRACDALNGHGCFRPAVGTKNTTDNPDGTFDYKGITIAHLDLAEHYHDDLWSADGHTKEGREVRAYYKQVDFETEEVEHVCNWDVIEKLEMIDEDGNTTTF